MTSHLNVDIKKKYLFKKYFFNSSNIQYCNLFIKMVNLVKKNMILNLNRISLVVIVNLTIMQHYYKRMMLYKIEEKNF